MNNQDTIKKNVNWSKCGCGLGDDCPCCSRDKEIERLSAENERLQAGNEMLGALRAETNAPNIRLREALERIADGCDLSNEAQAVARETLEALE